MKNITSLVLEYESNYKEPGIIFSASGSTPFLSIDLSDAGLSDKTKGFFRDIDFSKYEEIFDGFINKTPELIVSNIILENAFIVNLREYNSFNGNNDDYYPTIIFENCLFRNDYCVRPNSLYRVFNCGRVT